MSYEDVYHKLSNKGWLMWICVDEYGKINGIEVNAPGIDSFERTGNIMEIVGNEFKVVLFPNEGVIKVEKK